MTALSFPTGSPELNYHTAIFPPPWQEGNTSILVNDQHTKKRKLEPTKTNVNKNQTNNIEDATDIKEMLKQSIKSTEMLGKMVSELNATLRQQVQQTTVMLQLLANLLSKKWRWIY